MFGKGRREVRERGHMNCNILESATSCSYVPLVTNFTEHCQVENKVF
jgi:hypothetical protein